MNLSIEQDVEHVASPKSVFLPRCIVVSGCGLHLFLSTQTAHAGIKGTSVDTWNLLPCIAAALIAACIGRLTLNSPSATFLAGIGGVFGILDPQAGPYGGIVGLLVGIVLVLVPKCLTSGSTRRCAAGGFRV